VHDTAQGLALAGRLSGFEVLNVGTARHHTILELLEVIFDHVGWRPERLDLQVDKPVGVRSRAADNARIRELTGWEPTTPLEVGVARTSDWYVKSATPERLQDIDRLLTTR
jgi:nucleoside-diphosphate-sugar epimerase